MECSCGKCQTPVGTIDKSKALDFLKNYMSFEQYLALFSQESRHYNYSNLVMDELLL